MKLDITDQQGFVFKEKKRVQEVFLFANYEEGFLWPEDTKENGYKAEPKMMVKKKSLLLTKKDRHQKTSYSYNLLS